MGKALALSRCMKVGKVEQCPPRLSRRHLSRVISEWATNRPELTSGLWRFTVSMKPPGRNGRADASLAQRENRCDLAVIGCVTIQTNNSGPLRSLNFAVYNRRRRERKRSK